MPNSDFANFVASQQKPEAVSFDWEKERTDYLANVANLYERARDYLGEYLANSSVKISSDEVEVDEESYGSYRISRLLIDIGHQRVFLEPVGTMLIGSKGRVDLIGSIKRVPILLIRESVKSASDMIHVSVSISGAKPSPPPPRPPKEPWVWKLRSKRNPDAFDDLNKDTFLTAILDASRR